MPDLLNGSVRQYLDELASGAPTPGGGSAAGLVGALGAALLCMSARFTVGREKYAAFDAAASQVLAEADTLRVRQQALMEQDAEAYGAYRAASALPKDTEEQKAARSQALQEATKASAAVPMEIARIAYRTLHLAEVLAENCNPYLVSDVVVATHLALAAFNSAIINVRMNQGSLKDQDVVRALDDELQPMVANAAPLARTALEKAYRAMNIPIEGDLPR